MQEVQDRLSNAIRSAEYRDLGPVGSSDRHPSMTGDSTQAGSVVNASPSDARPARAASGSAIKWWIIAWALLLLAATITAWIKCPTWLTRGESGSTTIRNVGLVILAAVGLPLAIWRSVIAERQAQAAQRQSEIAEQNLLNIRFQKGVEMLGHPDIESVRIGGVHTLARLAAQYSDVFHLRVMQTLSAFVVDRTKADTEETQSGDRGHEEVGPVPALAKDVEAAMESIAYRSKGQIDLERGGTFRMDLADASIPGFIFENADFSGFHLTNADLTNAKLKGADLTNADLTNAKLKGADLTNADLDGANLTGADFSGDDLRYPSPARGLTQRQLDQARADPRNPPILDGTRDGETDAQLHWTSPSGG